MTISTLQKPIETGLGSRPEPSEILAGIDLSGKTALVTGGYSGIGLETVRALAAAGAHVHVPARDKARAVQGLFGAGFTKSLTINICDLRREFEDVLTNVGLIKECNAVEQVFG